MGLKHSRRCQAGQSGAWTIFPPKTQAKEGASEITTEIRWFFSSRQPVLMPAQQLLSPPVREIAQGQRAANLPFPKERPIGLLLHQNRRVQLLDCPGNSILA